MRQKLTEYFDTNKLPKLKDSLFEKLIMGSQILLNTDLEIDHENKLIRLEYNLSLKSEKDLWLITKSLGKESQEGDGWYDSIYPHKAIFKMLWEIVNEIYNNVAKKNKWASLVREKKGTQRNKDDSLCLYVQLRAGEERDFESDIVKIIKRQDIPIYRTIIKREMLSRMSHISDNRVIDSERKRLTLKVEQKVNRRIKEIEKPQLQRTYIERLKKARLINENCRILVDNKKFISLFKKISKKVISNEKAVYKNCRSCKFNYEVLTKQQRKYCYETKCRQSEYRIREMTRVASESPH
jgi:hypothetical protein